MDTSDLALVVINDGEGYPHRLGLARCADRDVRVHGWSLVAQLMAQVMLFRFQDHFSEVEIAAAADELDAYYAEHIKEIDQPVGLPTA